MTELQRVKKVIKWLIFMEYADNEKEIAEKFGYTKSSFSQIINGKVPLSNKFIKKLCSAHENINEVWVLKGDEEMLKDISTNTQNVTVPANVWGVIQTQAESLKTKDRQIGELVTLLKQLMGNEKPTAHPEDNAAFAAVG